MISLGVVELAVGGTLLCEWNAVSVLAYPTNLVYDDLGHSASDSLTQRIGNIAGLDKKTTPATFGR